MKKAGTRNRPSIYQTVADRIVSSLKAGVIPWEKPWKAPRSLSSCRTAAHSNTSPLTRFTSPPLIHA
ncbi:DUF1738 domain-containing protein [Alloacidobacterium dinghuense]|uniref:DUF1738 domain-containing protein n=1 Tax=Alloacidobacterium dinghuense TaxID=2763107 RepID=A0A7G8BNZ0_9BACT|nr:DUF1738 domain-containing protein [Alloacidobacterium dinghuense]